MAKGQERPSREKKKPKKDKGAKQVSTYASEYGKSPARMPDTTPGKKQ